MATKVNKLFFSLIFTFVSAVCLLSATFAWMTINNPVNTGDLTSQTSDKSFQATYYIMKNGNIHEVSDTLLESYKITTKEELNVKLVNTLPNDYYTFRIDIVNNKSDQINFMSLELCAITIIGDSNIEGSSILDYLYIENLYTSNNNEIRFSEVNSRYEVGIEKTVPDGKLSSNITNNNLMLFNNIPSSNSVSLYFSLCLHYTSSLTGQTLNVGAFTITSN